MTRFYQNDTEIDSSGITFPITELGTSTSVSIMIENESVADPVELIFYSDDGDISTDKPTIKLSPTESTQAKLTFSPPKDRPDSLRTSWGYREIKG